MNGYIIVLPEGTLTSEHRAKAITRELYNITAPLVTQEPYQKDGTVFGVIEHPDGIQFALQVDTEYNIPVSPMATLEKLITLNARIERGRNTTAFELRPQRAILPVWGNRSQHYDRKRPSVYDRARLVSE